MTYFYKDDRVRVKDKYHRGGATGTVLAVDASRICVRTDDGFELAFRDFELEKIFVLKQSDPLPAFIAVEERPSGNFRCTICNTTKATLDEQVGGDHYKKHGDYQPWEVLRRWLTPEEMHGFMKGSAIVYLAREKDKGGNEDIAKAMHYLKALLEFETN